MSEHDAFLRAIIENPANDGPRLVYADWLEERGEMDLAYAFRWSVTHKKFPLRCAPGIGWMWNCGRAKHGLPLSVFVSLPNRRLKYATSNLRHGRLYCRSFAAEFRALAKALRRARLEVADAFVELS